MKRQENRPQFRGLVKRALGFSLGRSGGEGSGVVRRLARAFVIRCVLGRTIFSAHKIGSKKAMLTGLTVLFDCPPGLVSLVGDGDGNELVRLVPQGEVDACLLVSRKPLFATGNPASKVAEGFVWLPAVPSAKARGAPDRHAALVRPRHHQSTKVHRR